jgi:hypothetical protein
MFFKREFVALDILLRMLVSKTGSSSFTTARFSSWDEIRLAIFVNEIRSVLITLN